MINLNNLEFLLLTVHNIALRWVKCVQVKICDVPKIAWNDKKDMKYLERYKLNEFPEILTACPLVVRKLLQQQIDLSQKLNIHMLLLLEY